MSNLVWTVEGRSESGDHYQAIFGHNPTEEELKDLAFEWDGDRKKPFGPGYAGSWVYLEICEAPVR